MKRLALFAVLLFGLASLSLFAAEAEPASERLSLPEEVALDGYYKAEGKLPGDNQYDGVACVVKRGKVYRLTWTFETGAAGGVGIREGDTLFVASQSGQQLVCCRYKISKDKEGKPYLSGRWAAHGGPLDTFEETLTFIRSSE